MALEPRESAGPWRWLAAGVAILVTAGVVGGLVYQRLKPGAPDGQKLGTVAVNGVDFSCRLPVLAGATGGFISFPDGAVTVDRRVTLNFYKGGTYGFTYDTQVGRWVPVASSALSPDGRSYAYVAETTGVPGQATTMSLHTHEILSAKDRVLWESSGSSMGPNVVTWLPGGIYFTAVFTPAGGVAPGPTFPAVYVSDPNLAGAPRRVGPNPAPQVPDPSQPYYSGPDMFTLFGGGAAWATANRVPKVAPSLNAPPPPGTYGPDRVLRMDLRDGSVSNWFTVTGNDLVSLVGLDPQGRPILSMFQPQMPPKTADAIASFVPPPVRFLVLTGPGQTVELTSDNPNFHPAGPPSADKHGIWFGSWNSVWLYTQNGGLRQVATIPAGLFPSPSPPPGLPQKPIPSGKPAPPAYMQGTLVSTAGPCT